MPVKPQKPVPRLLAQTKVIPIIENRAQLQQLLKTSQCKSLIARHCDILELAPQFVQAPNAGIAVYVQIEHIYGVNADPMGLQFLANQLHIAGIISTNPKVLATAKAFGMDTALRIFAADSTGLEGVLEGFDTHSVDLLDVSPALVIPYIAPLLIAQQPLPFIGSGLVATSAQINAVLQAGASAVAVNQGDFFAHI